MISQSMQARANGIRPSWEKIEYGLLATLSALGFTTAFVLGLMSFLSV